MQDPNSPVMTDKSMEILKTPTKWATQPSIRNTRQTLKQKKFLSFLFEFFSHSLTYLILAKEKKVITVKEIRKVEKV